MPAVAIDPKVRLLPSAEEAFSWYVPLVQTFEQAVPMLVCGGDFGTASMPLDEWDRVPDAVVAGITVARLHGFNPTWALVSSEAWERYIDASEENWEEVADRIQHGDLEKAAALGDERVHDIVSIWGMTHRHAGYIAKAGFTRAKGYVSWGELEVQDIEHPPPGVVFEGEMFAALKHALRQPLAPT